MGNAGRYSIGRLIRAAEGALNPQRLVDDLYVADVGSAVVAEDGRVFTGACIGGPLGVCAEQSAVSAMVSKAGPGIRAIVAVWRSEEGELHVIPPCGRCREFLRMLSQTNLDADVILGPGRTAKLKDLLPYHGWYAEKVERPAGATRVRSGDPGLRQTQGERC